MKRQYDADWYQEHKEHRARYMRIWRLQQKLKKAKKHYQEIRLVLEDKAEPVIAAHEYILHLKRLEQIALGS